MRQHPADPAAFGSQAAIALTALAASAIALFRSFFDAPVAVTRQTYRT